MQLSLSIDICANQGMVPLLGLVAPQYFPSNGSKSAEVMLHVTKAAACRGAIALIAIANDPRAMAIAFNATSNAYSVGVTY